MWEYTTPSHGLPIGAFFRGESARNTYRRNEDYSITKGNSTVVLGTSGKRVEGLREAAGMPSHVVLDGIMADHSGRSRGGFRCAIIWRSKPARTTATCARRLFADRL